jgi:hypothetical protein
MNASIAKVQPPKLPAPETISDPRFTIRDRTGGHLISYCPINTVGGIYSFETQRWQIQCGMPFLEFVMLTAACGLGVDDSPEARLWFESCLEGNAIGQCAGNC